MTSTARGIGIRFVILIIGVLLVGFWLLGLAFKVAFAALHFLLWIGLILIVIGVIAYLVQKFKRAI
ncbi:MAG TPA: hypothetical protein VFN10_16540 [Thermoanaerobaculia bacterium]|nr:hypothetical protein [Thermoanaerobaculia bacterium]